MGDRAIVCHPSSSLVNALRMKHLGEVDAVRAFHEHATFRSALRSFLGFQLIEMDSQEAYPDSVFVEDPAVIVRDILVIARLRKEERQGEEEILERRLAPHFRTLCRIVPPGYVEGGDVLVTGTGLYIGLSNRTNEEGAEQLARIARDRCGFATRMIRISDSWLHLKGGVSYQPGFGGIIAVTEEIAHEFRNSGYRLLVTPSDEHFGANCISRGNKVLVHEGRTKTRALLERQGFRVLEVSLYEYAKVDGAMSCLAKLW